MKNRKAIALLITMLFIVAITASIGLGLKYINETATETKKENFMYQVAITVDDILTLLQNSKELEALQDSNSSAIFYQFLSTSGFLPFESSGMSVTLSLKSARAKFNPNSLNKKNTLALQKYMSINMVNNAFAEILLDSVNGIKEDLSYNTDLFIQKPYIFRDYISSKEHLNELISFYEENYHDNALEKIDFDELFYFSKDKSSSIDLNFATVQTWELLLGTTQERAEELVANAGVYSNENPPKLNAQETASLSAFKVSYYEPYLDIVINMQLNGNKATVTFEYDIKNKKGSNFTYAI